MNWDNDTNRDVYVYWSNNEFTKEQIEAQIQSGTVTCAEVLTQNKLDTTLFKDAGEYTRYYYVHSVNPNYSSFENVYPVSVIGLPKPLSVSAVGTVTKEYDGNAGLTDKNRQAIMESFANGTLYKVEGLCEGEEDNYTLAFDDKPDQLFYNNVHCTEANAVGLNNIWVLNQTPGRENIRNYTFGNGASLTITGIPLFVKGKQIMEMKVNYTGNGAGLAFAW